MFISYCTSIWYTRVSTAPNTTKIFCTLFKLIEHFCIFFYILDIPEDIEDQKEDEKLAIQSIYGDSALVEKIPGKLWELKLENLSLIETMLPSTMKKPPRNPNVVTREMLEKDPSVCQWYLRPKGCKFGKKCFKKHVNPDKDHVGVDDKHLKDLDADEKVVILEIRWVQEFKV